MKTVRVWFKKTGSARFISHLDLNRCMARAIHKAKIPLWYTKGFNPHAFLTFALPLSLGIEGIHESMDIKLDDDSISESQLIERMNLALPNDIFVYAVTEPVMKPGKIAWASYMIKMEPARETAEIIAEQIKNFFLQSEIIVPKHTKKGIVDWNISPYMNKIEICAQNNMVCLKALLPAGSTINVNPGLILEAIKKYLDLDMYTQICRTNLYDENMKIFQ